MATTAKLTWFLSLAVLAAGCTKATVSDLAVEKRELGELHDFYMGYLKSNDRPPTEPAQLQKQEALYAAANRAVRQGKYKVVWGVSDKNASTLLAYEADAAEKGGVVLMADGTVKTMTAAQVQAAKK